MNPIPAIQSMHRWEAYFSAPEGSSAFQFLYGKDSEALQVERYRRVLCGFAARFGEFPVALISAPGRTELCGNHTDHQHGRVLAAAVSLDLIAAVRPNEGSTMRVCSEGFGEATVSLENLAPRAAECGTSAALVRGVAAALRRAGFRAGGFDAFILSDVPQGSGLSSSAAFEILLGTIHNILFNTGTIPPIELAKAGQTAENAYFGKPCGLMDQAACAVGGFAYMDFASAAEPEIEKLSLELGGRMLCIVNTGGNHADLTDDYASIPAEMKAVAAVFGKNCLREVDEAAFYASLPALRETCGDRAVLRAIHFFAENERVYAQRACIRAGDTEGFLSLVRESGDSSFKYLQNIYTVKNVGEQGLSLALALCGRLGAVCRVHGGGFAGTVQAYVEKSRAEVFRDTLSAVFGESACLFLSFRPYGAVRVEQTRILEGETAFDV